MNTQESSPSALKELMLLASPVGIAYFIEMNFSVVPLFFLGRLGSPENLAAAALANLYMNCTGYAFFYGIACAIDTLGSQAHGAGKSLTVGLVTQRTILVLFIMSFVVLAVWLLGSSFLSLLGQPANVCDLAKLYMYYRIPAIWPCIIYECLKKFLSCRGITHPPVITGAISLVANVVGCYVMINVWGWGFIGAPIAWTIANVLNLVLLSGYIWCGGLGKGYWPSLSWDLFHNLKDIVILGFQGAAQVFIEWASFEIGAIISGNIGTNDVKAGLIDKIHEADSLAAHTIVANTVAIFFMVPLSVGIATSILVGNSLGRNDPEGAKAKSHLCLKVNLVWSLIAVSTLLGVRSNWAYIFTNDASVAQLVSDALLYAAVFILFDGTQCQLGYILRGCGLQKYGAIANAISFPLIGLPSAAVIGLMWFKKVTGVWLGMACGNAMAVLILSIAYSTIKWDKVAAKAAQRIKAQGSLTEGLLDPAAKSDEEYEDGLLIKIP